MKEPAPKAKKTRKKIFFFFFDNIMSIDVGRWGNYAHEGILTL